MGTLSADTRRCLLWKFIALPLVLYVLVVFALAGAAWLGGQDELAELWLGSIARARGAWGIALLAFAAAGVVMTVVLTPVLLWCLHLQQRFTRSSALRETLLDWWIERATGEQGEAAVTDTTPDMTMLQTILDARFPTDRGRLEAIFIRPAVNERAELTEAVVTAAEGVRGDRWNGKDPRTQITLMNAAVLDCCARGDRSRWALAGDQLIVDLDLSEQNLPVGQRLAVGEALLEVTDEPHLGCGKFKRRFGADVLAFINARERRHLRLRGCYVQVVVDGAVRAGDEIVKVAGPGG